MMEEHLAKAELARSLALATGGDPMVLLPVVADLDKVIKTAEQSHGQVFHEEDFRLCGYTDTESGPVIGSCPIWELPPLSYGRLGTVFLSG